MRGARFRMYCLNWPGLHRNHFPRRSGLTKLLQLLNILRGEMSLAGPRPEEPEITGTYTE